MQRETISVLSYATMALTGDEKAPYGDILHQPGNLIITVERSYAKKIPDG